MSAGKSPKGCIVRCFFINACYRWFCNCARPAFSQFYAAPLYLNPAFAGATGQARVGTNYRNQWPAIDANFNTISAFADFYVESKNSGVGVIINNDREGLLGLKSTSIGLIYAYELKVTKGLSFDLVFKQVYITALLISTS